jgi:Icc protein
MTKTIRIPVDIDVPIRLVQFTDTHIFADTHDRFDGTDTADTFKRLIEYAKTQDWPPHLALVTGDLVHDPVVEAYKRFHQLVDEMHIPVCCLPGNHDDPDIMEKHLNTDEISTAKQITAGNWLILLLNSHLSGTHGGHLHDDELAWLDSILIKHPEQHVLICLHHHPVSIDSPWMDAMSLDNPDDFFAVLDRYNHVKGILWGHIHQEFVSMRNGVALYGTPSTCIQFIPHTNEFRRDELSPACRWLELASGGDITTHVGYAGSGLNTRSYI